MDIKPCYRVAFWGQSQVGKSSIISRIGGNFDETEYFGSLSRTFEVVLKKECGAVIHVLDTFLLEEVVSAPPMAFFDNCDIIVLVFSIVNANSLKYLIKNAQSIIHSIVDSKSPTSGFYTPKKIVLVGNKLDLCVIAPRAVQDKMVHELAQKLVSIGKERVQVISGHVELSAATREGFDSFMQFLCHVLKNEVDLVVEGKSFSTESPKDEEEDTIDRYKKIVAGVYSPKDSTLIPSIEPTDKKVHDHHKHGTHHDDHCDIV
ncbi:Small GTPase like protein [Aduncisulcus paluster]|uniref:Small GTPase like protein n=1 Tax=Aduncisulcus paluster TaxID=2918883 RepID=A0ABQ5K589_9EUKA|nr:Small GTPase like protein [Aduncisulcus paluster]|eukprot:gnl/Carplike_NY0171/1351_a1838_616.p1 GENE.gnl/Carplike_NY0171/1351_a1838_616~~gnl/Carplike_NY0171/1351_a1838_616.p1  ORF type:complete len:261 (-),score=38.98 gnl/Carplike_NY0171/1351_a1838_616:539-1321(-)